jgi:hypothetical protein
MAEESSGLMPLRCQRGGKVGVVGRAARPRRAAPLRYYEQGGAPLRYDNSEGLAERHPCGSMYEQGGAKRSLRCVDTSHRRVVHYGLHTGPLFYTCSTHKQGGRLLHFNSSKEKCELALLVCAWRTPPYYKCRSRACVELHPVDVVQVGVPGRRGNNRQPI